MSRSSPAPTPSLRPLAPSATDASAWVLALALLVALVGCGDGGSSNKPPPAAAPTEAPAGPDPVTERWDLLGENPRWVPIKDLFQRYADAKIEDLANPMLPNLVLSAQRPVIERRPTDKPEAGPPVPTAVPGAPAEMVVIDPRTTRPLAEFKAIILMTGTSRPKAVVVDGTGERFTVERGDPLGSEGGRVKAILQYQLLVGVPGKADPVVMSLEPPLANLDTEVGKPARDF